MNPGRMRYRITLERPSDKPDGLGGRIRTYENMGMVWADIRNPKIREQLAAGTPATELTSEIIVRCGSGIQRGWRIREQKHVYEVIGIKAYDREVDCVLVKEVES